MADLTLTGAIPGLLLRGSPVNVDFLGPAVPGVYTAPDTRPVNQRNGPHLVAPVDYWPEDFNGSSEMIRSCRDEEVTLDLTHPLGLATALHYLKERGRDLAWATRWPDVIAWSVLSVSRGGGPIVGVARWVYWGRAGCLPHEGKRYDLRSEPGNGHVGVYYTGRKGSKEAAEGAVLTRNYALENNGSLTLPPPPEVPRG